MAKSRETIDELIKSRESLDDAPMPEQDDGNARAGLAVDAAMLMAEGKPAAWIGEMIGVDRQTAAKLAAEYELAALADKHIIHPTNAYCAVFLGPRVGGDFLWTR